MPFFIRKKQISHKGTRRLKVKAKGDASAVPKKVLPSHDDSNLNEEITSDEDDDYVRGKRKFTQPDEDENHEDQETAQEKKVRLARQYISELQQYKAQDENDEEMETDDVGRQLRDQVLEAAGKLHKTVADSYVGADSAAILTLKSRQQHLPVTVAVVSKDERWVFSASKDCSIVKWSLTGEKLGVLIGGHKGSEETFQGHCSHILSLAVCSDGKFLASGDRGGFIHIWDAATLSHLKKFKKHRGAVSGLVFRQGTHTLYSASHDRLVMVWNLDAMAFVEHLGGHQDAVTGIDALMRESCITSGGRDESVIVYVIIEDKQLRFLSHQGSVDGVKLINEKTFLTFGQDGSLALWTTLKKRPHFIVKAAHGRQKDNAEANWITSVASFVNTDLVASGSCDGFIRFWKMEGHNRLSPLFSVPVVGVVNSLAFTASGSHLIAGIGQEHKLGRWSRDPAAKNVVMVIPLLKQ